MEVAVAELTFDLVMENDMSFVEGCYRLPNEHWHIFIFVRERGMQKMIIEQNVVWESGNTGFVVTLPEDVKLNKDTALKILSDISNVAVWSEVRGPDSMQLR